MEMHGLRSRQLYIGLARGGVRRGTVWGWAARPQPAGRPGGRPTGGWLLRCCGRRCAAAQLLLHAVCCVRSYILYVVVRS